MKVQWCHAHKFLMEGQDRHKLQQHQEQYCLFVQENITLEGILLHNFIFLQTSKRYRKIVSFNTSRLEAHAGFFRLLMKGIFNPYVL